MDIRFEDVSFAYDEEYVLKDFNLKINSGELLVILGHNGSGKSTIAKIMMGLLPINNGKIYINDEELTEENCDKIRLNMGIIFQNPDNQFVGVTVRDDVAFGLENRCLSREEMTKRIDKYIKLVSMENYLNANPEDLSGGQKQRVAIAGALAMETDLLIFDESTSMLDPKGTKEVNEMIKKIKDEHKKTIVVITHDLDEAKYADRIIVLNNGKVVLEGTPEKVFKETKILEASGLKTIDSVELLNDLKNKKYNEKKAIEEALWELTFKM